MIQPQLLLGAAHVLEMPFVFRDCKGEFDPFRSNTAKNAVGRQQVSDAMASYWAQFAYTAMPGRGLRNELAAWQRWSLSPATEQLMVFDTAAGGGCRMVSHHLSVEQLKQRLSSDPAFAENGLERSQLYARMFRWSLFVEPPASTEMAVFFARHDASGTVQNWCPAYWP